MKDDCPNIYSYERIQIQKKILDYDPSYSIYTIIDLNTKKRTNVSEKGYNMAGAP